MQKLKYPALINKINFKDKKTIALLVLLAIGIGLTSWSFLKDELQDNRKVYAQVAGHKIYEQEVRDLIGDSKDISDYDATKVLADKYLTEELAEEQGISISEQELIKEFGKEVVSQKINYKYAYQNKANQLYLTKLQAHNNGIYKGKFIVANFSDNIAFDPALPEDKIRNPQLGDAAAIAKDKKYALDLITRLYNEITSGKITFEEAMEIERNDPKVGLKAYPSLSHSGSFDTTYTPIGILNTASIRQKVNGIKAGEITEPFAVKVRDSLDDSSSMVESYFLVVQMDETSGSYTGMEFDEYIEQAKKRLEYEINV